VSTVELDPFGGDTYRSDYPAFQPHYFTTYERDTVGGMDEAMARRYHGWWSRFSQPDPYDGSYSLADPQSFKRYSYVQNDPVNFVDPSGLFTVPIGPPPSTVIIPISFNDPISGGAGVIFGDNSFLLEETPGDSGGGGVTGGHETGGSAEPSASAWGQWKSAL
jgi:RHS repeat-associated protein